MSMEVEQSVPPISHEPVGEFDDQPKATPSAQPQPQPTEIEWTTWLIIKDVVAVALIVSIQLTTQSSFCTTLQGEDYIAVTLNVVDNPGQRSWFSSSFSMIVGTFVLPAGRVGDVFGSKLLTLIGLGWAALWALLAGISNYTNNVIFFSVCRGLQGLGFGIALPNGVAIMGRMYPNGSWQKTLSFCVFGASAPNGAVLGQLFMVLMGRNSAVGWPWAYYVFCIALTVITLLGIYFYPGDEELLRRHHIYHHAEVLAQQKKEQEMQAVAAPTAVAPIEQQDSEDTFTDSVLSEPEAKAEPLWQKLDLLGSIVGVSGMVLFNFALSQAPVVGWTTVYVYVLLAVGVVLIGVFLFIETRVPLPILPPHVFNVTGSLMLACVSLGWTSFGVFAYYTIRYMLEFRHDVELTTVAEFSPVCVMGIIAGLITAVLMATTGPSVAMAGAMLAFLATQLLLATLPFDDTQPYWAQLFIVVIVAPLGMDMSFPSSSLAISDTLPAHEQGVAGSLVNTVVNYSIAIGLGFAGTIEQQLNDGGRDEKRGMRGCFYFGIGITGLGVLCASVNIIYLACTKGRAAFSGVAE